MIVPRAKLVITDDEAALIKGLIEHTDLNDQTIVAIFSHKSRNINNREIGYFRDRNNPKYQDKRTAGREEVKDFLCKYDKFEQLAKLHGLQPKEEYFDLIQKASEAMKNAVATYNNPNIRWKTETYIVNAVIAWTYLMHAYYITQGVDYVYTRPDGQRVLTNEGHPKLWELSKCINNEDVCPLPIVVVANLRYLIAIRNEIEHSMCNDLSVYVGGKLQACALNFNVWLCSWFGKAYSIAEDLAFSIQFTEFSLQSHPELVGQRELPTIIQTVNGLIERGLSSDEYNDSQYSYRVFVVPRTVNNRNKADQAVKYAPLGSDVEMAVREVERPKYTATDIVNLMRQEGYASFSIHGRDGFVKFWQSIDGKNVGRGFGVSVVGSWYWYERMVDEVRAEMQRRQSAQR